LSIGNPSRSSSSTKEATIVVVGLGRERKVFGHLAFLDQPQSPSDKVDEDGKTNDREQEERNDDTGDSATREFRARLAGSSSFGFGLLDGRGERLKKFRSPAGSP
jgi:hypothetical protein